jgi:predicted transcriptional regulator
LLRGTLKADCFAIYDDDISNRTYRMRTLVDIPDAQLADLSALGESLRQPRAALIRAAISEYLAVHRRPALQDAFGLWGTAAADGLAYQKKVRAEW